MKKMMFLTAAVLGIACLTGCGIQSAEASAPADKQAAVSSTLISATDLIHRRIVTPCRGADSEGEMIWAFFKRSVTD